jgi:ketosteroid isomerase-like protein
VPVRDEDRRVVEDLLRAMETGPGAEAQLLGLFADDAVLVEPFTGRVKTHTGKKAIRAALALMWQNRAPDLKLTLDCLEPEGDRLRAEWTCTSSLMPGALRGHDLLTLRGGKISRLEIIVTELPRFGG